LVEVSALSSLHCWLGDNKSIWPVKLPFIPSASLSEQLDEENQRGNQGKAGLLGKWQCVCLSE